MRKDAFSKLHPAILLLYFAAMLFVTMFTMHPLFLGIGAIAAWGYCCVLQGVRRAGRNLIWMILLVLLIAVCNALFQHGGVTRLFRLPSGNAVTLEALLFGAAAGAMLAETLLWFSCYQQVVTAEKFLYVFGGILPSTAMLLSMAMRFVPKFRRRMAEISRAQQNIGRGSDSGSMMKRLHCGARVFSIAVTWALESGVVAADSMKSRGYGTAKRTRFSRYRWDARDRLLLGVMALFFAGAGAALGLKGAYTAFYPAIKVSLGGMTTLGCACYGALALLPLWINGKEALLWRHLNSGI